MTETPRDPDQGASEGGEEATQAQARPEGSEAAEATSGPPDAGTEGGEPSADEQQARLRREAAARRVQLRETEAERDRLRQQVAAFQRNAVEAIAAARLEDASDVWRDGVELSELLADDGAIDGDAVVEAVERVVAAHPAWAKGRRAGDPDFGGGARRPITPPPSFGEVLKQVRGRPG